MQYFKCFLSLSISVSACCTVALCAYITHDYSKAVNSNIDDRIVSRGRMKGWKARQTWEQTGPVSERSASSAVETLVDEGKLSLVFSEVVHRVKGLRETRVVEDGLTYEAGLVWPLEKLQFLAFVYLAPKVAARLRPKAWRVLILLATKCCENWARVNRTTDTEKLSKESAEHWVNPQSPWSKHTHWAWRKPETLSSLIHWIVIT